MVKKDDIRLNTYTHIKDEYAVEVFLVRIDSLLVGEENNSSPVSFNREHITTWMKTNYYFTGNKIVAQVPRDLKYYPQKARNEFASNLNKNRLNKIFINKESQINFYYSLLDSNKYILVSWDICKNDWKMRSTKNITNTDNKEIIWEL